MTVSRLVNLWGFSVHGTLRYWRQSVALVIPLTLVIAVVAAMTFVRDGFQRDAKLSSAFLPDITVQVMSAGRATHVPDGVADQIAKIDSVGKVVPRVWGFLPMRVQGREVAYSVLGIDPAQMPISPDIRLAMKSGRFLEATDTQALVLGESAASALNVKSGDNLVINTPEGNEYAFRVVGVFTSAVQIYTADLLITHITDARKFFGYSDQESTDLCVYASAPEHVDCIAAEISKSMTDSRVLTRDKLTRISEQAYGSRSGMFQILWLILLVAVALMAWSQTSATSMQMRKEIGILKAMGWSTMDIIQTRLFSMLVLTLLACLGGVAMGMGYLALGAPGIREYFLGWAAVYPEFAIPVCVRIDSLATLVAVGTVPILAAVIVPSWLAGITEPDSAIRSG